MRANASPPPLWRLPAPLVEARPAGCPGELAPLPFLPASSRPGSPSSVAALSTPVSTPQSPPVDSNSNRTTQTASTLCSGLTRLSDCRKRSRRPRLDSSLKIDAHKQPVGQPEILIYSNPPVLMALLRSGHKPCVLVKLRRQKCRTAYCMLPLRLRNHLDKVCAPRQTQFGFGSKASKDKA